jgi:hypothetical protein
MLTRSALHKETLVLVAAAKWVQKGHKTSNSWAAACIKDKTARQSVWLNASHPFYRQG